jgi:hypothetical protein
MAGIVMCDRCNRLGKGTALGGIAYRTNIADRENKGKSIELCPGCVASFLAWLNNPKADPATPALSAEPFTDPYADPSDPEGEA